ncbi:TerB family tellurite resistance protein [Pelagibius sp. CAU 1746]|uniref:TerB family tellurite resistance protein n=1 Tax=Pelagibius sp. CAU 1746 TaxID=3140370 RepID=UPI00325AFFD2
MHIVLAVLGIAAGIGVWLWRAHMAARAAGELMDTADDIRSALRRFGYRRKANANPLDGIDDPRLAAAGVLAAFAKMEGGIGRAEVEAISEECRRAFRTDAAEAAQIGAYGRWLVQQSANMDEAVRRLARNLEGKLSEAEKDQFLEMIERVASIDDGALTDGQRHTLAQLASQLN